MRIAALALSTLLLTGCGSWGSGGPVDVVAIGPLHRKPDGATAPLSLPDRLLLDATAQGLVGFSGEGQVEAGLAERWTVIDGGRSYIFRLREARWADGRPLRATEVARILHQRITSRRLRSEMRGEFGALRDIRAMTGRVIEIRLHRPQPELLDLLAQPDLAISRNGDGWGPWRPRWSGGTVGFVPVPSESAEEEEADADGPVVRMWGAQPAGALAQYEDRQARILLGGRFEHWPLMVVAGIPRDQVVIDPVDGLFGFAVVSDNGLLDSELGRNAIGMAIDQARIAAAFDGAQMAARTTLRQPPTGVGAAGAGLPQSIYPAWYDMPMAQRRLRARAIVADRVSRDGDGAPVLRIALPEGPGARLIFALVRADLAAVGVDARRVALSQDADLRLIDEVAPSGDPGWFLRRLGCDRGVSCGDDLTPLLEALDTAAPDAAARLAALTAAEEAVMRHAGFFPIAAPLRWSLQIQPAMGVQANARARHSLIRLVAAPD